MNVPLDQPECMYRRGISRSLDSVGQFNADLIRINDGDDSYLLSAGVALLFCSENSRFCSESSSSKPTYTKTKNTPTTTPTKADDCIPIITRFVIPHNCSG